MKRLARGLPDERLISDPSPALRSLILNDFEAICQRLREDFERKNSIREACLARSREVVRASANAIRHIHRGDAAGARALLEEALKAVAEMKDQSADYNDIYVAGYVHDAQKEFA